MSLPVMRRRLEGELNYALSQFRDDMKLMVSNAATYNLSGEPVHGMALEIGRRFEELLRGS